MLRGLVKSPYARVEKKKCLFAFSLNAVMRKSIQGTRGEEEIPEELKM